MAIEQIKARLFDLQSHSCNGRLTIHPDGRRDPGDRDCSRCSEILRLRNKLSGMETKEPCPHCDPRRVAVCSSD